MKQNIAHSILPYLCLGLLAGVAVVAVILLWLMLVSPTRWSELVDKENNFWVGKGLVSESAAARFRRFEKGPGQKILVGLVGAVAVVCLVIALVHRKP